MDCSLQRTGDNHRWWSVLFLSLFEVANLRSAAAAYPFPLLVLAWGLCNILLLDIDGESIIE